MTADLISLPLRDSPLEKPRAFSPPESSDHGRASRAIRLRDRSHGGRSGPTTSSLADRFEAVVQESIRVIRKNLSENVPDLESLIFIKTVARLSGEGAHRQVPELELLAEPIGWYEFRLEERRFVSIEHPVDSAQSPERIVRSRLDRRGFQCLLDAALKWTAEGRHREVSRREEEGGESRSEPVIPELLVALFTHLDEVSIGHPDPPVAGEPMDRAAGPVHPARRAAIREWSRRQELYYRKKYKHQRDEGNSSYTYPIVDAVAFDGGYLALVLMSQLNFSFIDEKVPDDQRINPLTLAIYNVRNRFAPAVLETVLPLLKQAFARVLFTHTTDLNDRALNVSFNEVGKISRQWVRKASDGLRGLLREKDLNRPFDPFSFCEAVVDSVLCRLEDVATEVYPFDRVLIFREAGVKDLSAGEDEGGIEQRQAVPIELLVLEASVVSNSPADRGRYLTRRERRLRDTHDFECDPAKKKIRDRFRFYIHGHYDQLILSRRSRVSDKEKEQATRAEYKSRRSENQPDKELYFIGHADVHDPEKHDRIDSALYNLIGRVIGSAIEEKYVKPPPIMGEGPGKTFKTVAFRDEFRKVRLQVLNHFDQDGLYFQYEHGLSLELQIPILHHLLAAYNEYLDDKFRKAEEQFLRDKYLEESLGHRQIDELIRLHRHGKNVYKRHRRADGNCAPQSIGEHHQKSKVVYISFSPWLHEENAQLTIDGGRSRDDAGRKAMLLGDEYSFTMVLISDKDRAKNQAHLQAERNDLGLYFQMLLRQIWMDKLNEHTFLARKSRTISECLTQLLHRAKGLLPQAAQRERDEMDGLFAGLRKLTAYETSALESFETRNAAEIFSRLLNAKLADENGIQEALGEQAASWGASNVRVEFLPSPLPRLELSWSQAVASDAYTVVFKNACETARTAEPALVRVSARAVSSDLESENGLWYVVILVENSGGPIPALRLEKLNAANPEPVSRDPAKASSTGIGVFVSRYQLQNVIGQGADLMFLNTDDSIVQVRLRLPARPLKEELSDVAPVAFEAPAEDYVLYVEDSREQYEVMYRKLEEILSPSGLLLRHCEDYETANWLVQRRLPRLLLTDLSILRAPQSPELPDVKNGLALLARIMERGSEKKDPVPLLILTSEPESTVRQLLGSLPLSHGYSFIPVGGEVSRPGTIRILSELKADLKKSKNLRELMESVELGSAGESVKEIRAPSAATDRISFEAVRAGRSLGAPSDPGALRLCLAKAGSFKQLANVLQAWFQHPGMLDPDPLPGFPQTFYKLTNHVYLRRLLLAVIPSGRVVQLNVRFRYWGLMNNFWLTKKETQLEELVALWLKLRHEAKGPLSTLRHDVLNQWITPTLSGLLDDLLNRIKICEHLLSYPDDEKRALEVLFKGSAVTGKDLEKLASVGAGGNRAFEAIDAVIKALQAGLKREPSLEPKIDAQSETLYGLQVYLGGVR